MKLYCVNCFGPFSRMKQDGKWYSNHKCVLQKIPL